MNELEEVKDALDEAVKRNEALVAALENISDNALTIEDAVRIADAALAAMEQKP
jgi:hypothetical protein